jgi:hypothetical protein
METDVVPERGEKDLFKKLVSALNLPKLVYRRLKHARHRALEFCYDTTAPGYAVVGAKGIHMCDEWRLSLRKFLEDMAPSYVEGKSLLRTDATKDYRKENCYWGDSNPGSSIKHSVKALGYDAVIWAKVRAVYHSFHNQCYDPARKGYPSWGGRGIKFCDEWKESSRQFILDMIDGYTDGATIELIDDCAPMSADNCVWVPGRSMKRSEAERILISKQMDPALAKDIRFKRRMNWVWAQAKQRCYNPKHPKYPIYGGMGIKMCEEWKDNFWQFFADMAAGFTRDDLTLDRIDCHGDYCKENCRWATIPEQNKNRRNHIWVETHRGTLIFEDASRFYDVNSGTARGRMYRGWAPSKWFIPSTTTPPGVGYTGKWLLLPEVNVQFSPSDTEVVGTTQATPNANPVNRMQGVRYVARGKRVLKG